MPTTRGTLDSAAPLAPPRPRRSPLKAFDPVVLLAINVGVVTYMWFLHDGLARSTDFGEWLVSIGQLTGLYAALAVLVGLVLVSRAPWLERRYGMDQMMRVHRIVGFTAFWLMVGHVLAITFGLAIDTDISLWAQIVDYVRNYPYMVNTLIGFGLFITIVVVSVRAIRRAISYEIWWFVHVSAYAAAALTFGHQTAIGADFVLDPWAFRYWTLLYLSVAVLIVGYRWIALLVTHWRHRIEVREVLHEGPGVVTLVLGGRRLDRLSAQAGQFFLLRMLERGSWWKSHPFSLSAPPDGASLRFTVKALGDDTAAMQSIVPGTKMAIEGPYGGFLDALPTERKMLFIAGGIGITPFRGLIDDLERPGDVVLLYRNRTPRDAVFLDDLNRLSATKGFGLHLSYSRMNGGDPNPFEPSQLVRLIPDVREREVFVIGSSGLISAARNGLRLAGVPAGHIHLENFAY